MVIDVIDQLRLARIAKRSTQKDIAQQLGVSEMTLCKWETGATSPTLEKLTAWSAIFDMKVTLTNE